MPQDDLLSQMRDIREILDPIYGRLSTLESRVTSLLSSEGGGPALAASSSETTLVSSADETQIASVSIPALTLGLSNLLLLSFYFTYLNNSGAGRTLTLKLRYGISTLLTFGPYTIAASATDRAGWLAVMLKGNGSLTAQYGLGECVVGGLLGAGGVNLIEDWQTGSIVENSLQTQNLAVRAQHGISNANLSITGRSLVILGPILP